MPSKPGLACGVLARQGEMVEGPWIAFFDPIVTETAQEGYYPVYLFSRTLDAVYLSLNQGVTHLRNELGVSAARRILEGRAATLAARISAEVGHFTTAPISLQPTKTGSLLELYERGHAAGIAYRPNNVPPEAQLVADLEAMLTIYRLATARGGTLDVVVDSQGASDEDGYDLSLEERRRYFLHRRIERKQRLAREAKRIHGDRCQACDFRFADRYGELGAGYIEAHHKVPLHTLGNQGPTHLSARHDFIVVCANCHRMLHRPGAPSDFGELKRMLHSGETTIS